MQKIITHVNELNFSISELPEMPFPNQVLMVDPAHFTVEYVINPYMSDNIGKVNKKEARKEWKQIKETFESIGIKTNNLQGEENLPDMVFCANQSLPYVDEQGNREVVMGVMHSDHRKPEVPYIEQWYQHNGYNIHHLDADDIEDFEGCGDAIWHSGRRLLWGGYGHRSTQDVYNVISALFEVPVIALKLVDEYFYHLDTCFCVLDEKNVLIYPEAFTEEGRALINTVFSNVIRATEHEAKELFACNAVCPDGQNVLIQKGSTQVNKQLKEAGFNVHPLETEEFLKSGGSVFCMKQMVW